MIGRLPSEFVRPTEIFPRPRVLQHGERELEIDDLLAEVGQPIVETSSSVIKAFVGHCQPFYVFGEALVPAVAEGFDVCAV